MAVISEKYYLQFCNCLQNNVPFVAYRLPATEKICLFAADSVERFVFSGQNDIFSEEGFLVVPFDNKRQAAYLLRSASSIPVCGRCEKDMDRRTVPPADYFSAFQKMHTAIENGEISKVVLSRRHEIDNIAATRAVSCFLHLCDQQSSAYNYLLHLPGSGTWVGASPELFLKKDKLVIETVALAGTVPAKQMSFSDKEKEEQKIVSDYVAEVLVKFGIQTPAQNENIEIAGTMAHLKTVFQFPTTELKGSFGKFAEALHPTPAVCGYPKMQSKQLILSVERHNRGLYSGFLGKVENDGQCMLFVNIRCIQFVDNKAIVYAGGGITGRSDAQSEWNETELKLNSVLSMFGF